MKRGVIGPDATKDEFEDETPGGHPEDGNGRRRTRSTHLPDLAEGTDHPRLAPENVACTNR